MKRQLLPILFLCTATLAMAQVQQGVVKTIGRPDRAGQRLQGVTVRIREVHNAVVSGTGGSFTVSLPGKKPGDPFTIQSVQKQGYEPCEPDVIGRQYAYSATVPLTIAMVDLQQLEADKQRIEDNAYRVAERNFKAQVAELEQQQRESKISAEQLKEQIEQLQRSFEKYQLLIEGMADHYARTDYDELDEQNRRVSMLIEEGELEQADSLIRQMFDPVDLLRRHREAREQINQRLALAEEIQQKAREDMERVLKQQARDAEHLYQLYTIARAKGNPYNKDIRNKVTYYLTTRAELDTTNVEWQTAVGREDWIDMEVRLKYLQRAQPLVLARYGEHSLQMADIYDGLGNYYIDKCKEVKDVYSRQPELRDSLNERAFLTAYNYHQKALAIRLSLLGETHLDIGRSYERLGYSFEVRHCSLYDRRYITYDSAYTAACQYYAKAIEILESSNTKSDLSYLADICKRASFAGEYVLDVRTALKYKVKEVECLRHLHGETDEKVAHGYMEIARIYEKEKRIITDRDKIIKENKVEPDYQKALENNQKALAIYQALVIKDTEMLERAKKEERERHQKWEDLNNRAADRNISKEERMKLLNEMYALPWGLSVFGCAEKIFEHQGAVGTCYKRIGNNYRDLGDYAQALAYYTKYIDHKTMLQQTDTVSYEFRVKGYASSIKYGQERIDIARERVADKLALAYEYTYRGRLQETQGNQKGALTDYRQALKAEKGALGIQAPSLTVSADNTDAVFAALLTGIQQLQDIQRDVFGQKPFCLNKAYISLGDLRRWSYDAQKQDLIEGLAYYQKAHNLIVDSLGEHHLYTAKSHERMGSTYLELNDYEQAIAQYTQAINTRTALQPANDTIATDYYYMGKAYTELKEYQRAQENYLKELEICKAVYGEQSRDVARCYRDLGIFCRLYADVTQAFEYLQQALRHKASYGAKSILVAEVLNQISLTYAKQKDYEQALEYNQQALDVAEADSNLLSRDETKITLFYGNRADLYTIQNNYAQALQCRQKAYDAYYAEYGDKDPNVYQRQAQRLANLKYEITLTQYRLAQADGTLSTFLAEHCFTATIVDGDCPARQQGMDGEYILLEFADWTQDCPTLLFDKNLELRGKPKDILVMKDGIISRHHFDNTIGAQFRIKTISAEEKRRINDAYEKWKRKNGRQAEQ